MKIKTAIVGLGRIASLLEDDALREKPASHAGAISVNPDCILAAGSDLDEERRALFAARWGAPVYADAEEMIRAHRPSILVIATHPDSHYHYCKLAVSSGIPTVISEKPLADTLSDARKITALERQGLTIITNHERRYAADYAEAKDVLSSGKLGSIVSTRAVLYMGKNKRLLDMFWHDGTHLADALMFLSGGVLKHKRHWGAKLTDSSGTAWLEGELHTEDDRKIPVLMEVGSGRDHLVFELEFSCTKGRLRIGNGIFEVWESRASPYAEHFRSLTKTKVGFEGATGYFANMLVDAVACTRLPERVPVSSGRTGLAVIEYLHSVKAWR